MILRERLDLMSRAGAAEASENPREKILTARKRQVRVASELADHKVRAHSA